MFVFDEVDYAKKMLENGFIKAEYMQNVELMILAKYLFYIGKDELQVKDTLVYFCNKHRKYFNIGMFKDSIDSVVRNASKSNIRTGKQIHISKNEIKTIIHRTKDLNERKITFMKIAFTMLVFSKVYSDGVIKANRFEIFKMANVRVSEVRKMEILQELTGQGLINYKMPKGRDKTSGYIVTFAEDLKEGDYIYDNVNDLDKKLIKILNRFNKGSKEWYCENCGNKIIKTNNKMKYCSDCFKEIRKQKRIFYNKKYYKSKIKNK